MAMAHRNGGMLSPDTTHTLAQGLGWFSIGLGLAEVLATQRLARFLGMEEHTGLIRAYGVREIAAGIGILSQRDPTPWIWGRVGGDMLDLATLAVGFWGDNPQKRNVGIAVAAVAGVTVLDGICAQALSAEPDQPPAPMRDYSDRSGLPRPPEAMRGAARDFQVPEDMRTPTALRPYTPG